MRGRRTASVLVLAGLLMAPTPGVPSAYPAPRVAQGLEKIQHIIIIMQENRSFDHYFGVYEPPLAGQTVDGIPRRPNGTFAVCLPDPVLKRCVKPYHNTNPVLRMRGGPHGVDAADTNIDGGKMDGFVTSLLNIPRFTCARKPFSAACKDFTGPQHQPDVMSYLTREDIPNYWAYADWGVLQDRMFESVDSFSLPSHMYLFSGWAASCTDPTDPMSCRSDPRVKVSSTYPWTDISWLLNSAGMTWTWYVGDGTNICDTWPNCTPLDPLTATTPNWNPVPSFLGVKEANLAKQNVRHTSDFLNAAQNGTLPAVSWVIPGGDVSEHPGHAPVPPGEAYVTNLINTVGQGPDWDSTAIFLSWDDWGGFYDHVVPPRVDDMGYGLRVPGLVIGPYAKQGMIDHQTLSYDAYLKFIEDVFLGGQRLDPATDGRPDPRPTVREDSPLLGDLANDFDFAQPPRPAPLLSP